MVFLSSLVRALRESAERAIAHARPPGPIKHGGAAGPWKQQLRPLSSSSTSQAYAQPGLNYKTVHDYTLRPSKDPWKNLFRVIQKHAIKPVFQGLKPPVFKTQSRFADLAGSSFKRKPENKGWQFEKRPRLVSDVGLQLRLKPPPSNGFAHGAYVLWAPALGLRAAVDELQDELKSRHRPVKEKRNLHHAAPARPNRHGSKAHQTKAHQSKPVNYFERTSPDAYSDDTDSMPFSLDDDYCDTCSSLYIGGIGSPPESMQWDQGNASDTFAEVDQVPTRYTTTLRIPMSPDLFRILAGNVYEEERDVNDEVDFLYQIQDIAYDHHAFLLNVITPIERGLENGHLSQLQPQGWNAGQLFRDPDEDGLIYYPIHFINRTREEVLFMLQLDVGARLYDILQEHVTDDTGIHQDVPEEDLIEEDDEGSLHLSVEHSVPGEALTAVTEDGDSTPTERSRSTVDVAAEVAGLGQASLYSMDDQHNSLPASPIIQPINAADNDNLRFPIPNEMDPDVPQIVSHAVF